MKTYKPLTDIDVQHLEVIFADDKNDPNSYTHQALEQCRRANRLARALQWSQSPELKDDCMGQGNAWQDVLDALAAYLGESAWIEGD